jgi:hypothetical protein
MHDVWWERGMNIFTLSFYVSMAMTQKCVQSIQIVLVYLTKSKHGIACAVFLVYFKGSIFWVKRVIVSTGTIQIEIW